MLVDALRTLKLQIPWSFRADDVACFTLLEIEYCHLDLLLEDYEGLQMRHEPYKTPQDLSYLLWSTYA